MADKTDAWVEEVLGFPMSGSNLPAPGETDEFALSLDDYWRTVREKMAKAVEDVDTQVRVLQVVLREDDDPELNAIADKGMRAFTVRARMPLLDAVNRAQAGGPALSEAGAALFAAAQAFRAEIAGDPRVAAADVNPFGVQVSIRDTYLAAVDHVISVARAAVKR